MDNQDSPKFFETQAFKELNAKWREKLENSGFEDIEREDERLHNYSDHLGENVEYNQSKEEYYRLAGHFLHDHKFTNDAEKRVWELHSMGWGSRRIARKVPRAIDISLDPRNTTGGYDTRVKKVQATIKRLAIEMIKKCQTK